MNTAMRSHPGARYEVVGSRHVARHFSSMWHHHPHRLVCMLPHTPPSVPRVSSRQPSGTGCRGRSARMGLAWRRDFKNRPRAARTLQALHVMPLRIVPASASQARSCKWKTPPPPSRSTGATQRQEEHRPCVAETLDEEQWQFVLDGAYWSESASRSGVLAPCDDWFEKDRMSKSECLHFTLLCSLAPASVTCDALMHAESVEFDGRPATCALYEKVRQIDLLLCSMSNLRSCSLEALARTKQLVITDEVRVIWLSRRSRRPPIDGSGFERFPMLHVAVWHPDGLRLIPYVRAMTLSSFRGGWPERVDVTSESLVYLHIEYGHPACRLDTLPT